MRSMRCSGVMAAAVALSAALGGCGGPAGSQDEPKRFGDVDDARLLNAAREPQNWLSHGGDWNEQRFSSLDRVNADNVGRLGPAWFFEFDTTRGQEATPIVVDGVMYVSTAWSKVYALDAKTGRQIWFFDPKVPGPAGTPVCCDVVNRGVAVYEGKVYVGTLDGRLIALNAATGNPVWSVMTVEPNRVYSITGAPRAARGKVFIGNAGADFGGRGYVSAYDTSSGKLVWRFYTVPGDPAAAPDGAASDDVLANEARPTWYGTWYTHGGGGHVWNALVFDSELGQLYLGTGNGFPWNPNYRSEGKGDNLFISSIVALDADTGKYKWHYQETPGDAWDYDATADLILVDLPDTRGARKALLHASKNGFFYVLDRTSGKLISAAAYVPVSWATHVDVSTGRPAIVEGARYKEAPWNVAPGVAGAHNWHPVAFSPRTGLAYFAALENAATYTPTRSFEHIEGLPNVGIDLAASVAGGGAAHGAGPGVPARPVPTSTSSSGGDVSRTPAARPPGSYLLAWDPVVQKAVWRAETQGGGTLATGGNLVFQGQSRDGLMGKLVAYRSDDGRELWSRNTPNLIMAGPITYSVDGEQYVAVTSGASLLAFGAQARLPQPGRLIAFRLDGKATLPPDPSLAPAPNPPKEPAAAADVAAGKQHYDDFCARCHGFGTQSPNVVPDLRRSAMLTQKQAWEEVVIGGLLADRGMIGWHKFLAPSQAEAIRAYVGEEARKLQQEELATASGR